MVLNLPSEIPTDTEGLHNYLYTLVEQLKHGFNNIGEENLTEDLWEQITDEGGVLNADRIRSGRIVSADGSTYFDLDRDMIVTKTEDGRELIIKDGALYTRNGGYNTVQFGSNGPNENGGNFRLLQDGNELILLDAYEASGTPIGLIRLRNGSGKDTITLWGSSGRIRVYNSSGNERLNMGIGSSGDGYASFYNSSGTKTIDIAGQTGEVKCIPQNKTSAFGNLSNLTNCTGEVSGAYYSAGFCSVRISLTTTANIANDGDFTAKVSFPAGCTPLLACNSASRYHGRAVIGILETNGNITFHNCGSSNIASGHTIAMTFTYPCS